MSLSIDIDEVGSILLADGWHDVASNEDGVSTFDIDAYEYLQKWANYGKDKFECLHSGGAGFGFTDIDGNYVFGPVNSILAIKLSKDFIKKKVEEIEIELQKPHKGNDNA